MKLEQNKKNLPFVNKFRVDMQAKHKSREWLNTPGIAENNFHISYIHTKLVAESLLHIVRNFFQLFVRF
jgi:hypothetical protein